MTLLSVRTPAGHISKSKIFTEWISHTHVHSNKTPNTRESRSETLGGSVNAVIEYVCKVKLFFSLWSKNQAFHIRPIKEAFKSCSRILEQCSVLWTDSIRNKLHLTMWCITLAGDSRDGEQWTDNNLKKTFITRWVTGRNYSLDAFSWASFQVTYFYNTTKLCN